MVLLLDFIPQSVTYHGMCDIPSSTNELSAPTSKSEFILHSYHHQNWALTIIMNCKLICHESLYEIWLHAVCLICLILWIGSGQKERKGCFYNIPQLLLLWITYTYTLIRNKHSSIQLIPHSLTYSSHRIRTLDASMYHIWKRALMLRYSIWHSILSYILIPIRTKTTLYTELRTMSKCRVIASLL